MLDQKQWIKWAVIICLTGFLCWPVSVMAGCDNDTVYPRPNIVMKWRYYYGANIEPDLPGLPKLSTVFNGPDWVTITDANYITAAGIAQRCGVKVEDLKISAPPDCNVVPVISLGDPNILVFRYVEFEANAPASSIGNIYNGILTVMSEYTMVKTIYIRPTPAQILFWVEDCNE